MFYAKSQNTSTKESNLSDPKENTIWQCYKSTTIHYISKGYWSIEATLLFYSIGSSLTDFHGFLSAFMTNKAWSTQCFVTDCK